MVADRGDCNLIANYCWKNTQLSKLIESEVKGPINIAINPISIAIMRLRAIADAIKTHFSQLRIKNQTSTKGSQNNY